MHLWSLQQGMSLSKPVASALVQAGLAAINGASAPAATNPWVTLVLAQQATLDGRFDASLKISQASVEVHRAGSPWRQLALACALNALFHRGLLLACSLVGDVSAQRRSLDRRRVHAEALQPMLPLQAEIRGLRSSLPSQMQAQVNRMHAVLDALCDREPPDAVRLQLVSDLSCRKASPQAGQALLCSGLAYMFQRDPSRAVKCFDELADLSGELSWGLGRWCALFELCMHDASSRACKPPTVADMAAMVGGDFSTWVEVSGAVSAPLESRNAVARVERAKSFIRGSLGQRFSVSDVAGHCEVSTKTLGQDFKDIEDMTPLEFINRERIMLADQLLAQRQLNLKTVATAVGFDSVLGFSKAYARVTGRLPAPVSGR